MYKNALYIVFIAYLIVNLVDARKSNKRIKRPKSEDDSTPQPNVVTYSTFGFNDVRSYDGFVPSSPDYANYMSKFNQEASTRLYAPAFPTAMDNYPSPSQENPTFNIGDDTGPQASMLQYPQSSMSFMNTPNLDSEAQSQNTAPEIYGRNGGESGAPIYGTKISSRGKNKDLNQFNNTDFGLFESASSPVESKYSPFNENPSAFESKQPSFSDTSKNYQFNFNYATTHPTVDTDNFYKSPQSFSQTSLKFPKVVDFTKFKQNYPTELENQFTTSTTQTSNTYRPQSPPKKENEHSYYNNFEEVSTKYSFPSSNFKDPFKEKEEENKPEKESNPMSSYANTGFMQNYVNYPNNNKNVLKDPKPAFDYKDKFKYNPWPSANYTNDYKSWKNPIKGYQYSTNFSNMNFEFDFSGAKKSANNNNDEVVPASSNNIPDLTSYQFPDNDYSSFKKFPAYKGQENEDFGNVYESLKSQGYKYDPEEYVKSIYSTTPTTTTLWGSVYKTPEFSSYKFHGRKPQFGEEIGDDVVHIPKRPYSNKYSYGKLTESRPTEWSSFNSYRPHKSKKPLSDWNKEIATKFKSEEDLLGLRNQYDTSNSYLPTSYRPSVSSLTADYDYKKLVEKWRQSYLKAKYKDITSHDFDSYPSEPKPIHVPIPKPYPIEVPHPVIVPMPQPYPVRVPVPKPVAVPVVRELTVPVEKPVPYPVFKKVPYPIEKLVPVKVEKEVPVPVVKPYPVPIPHIRPVFHHTRPRDEIDAEIDEEDDYLPRPEIPKKISYAKRPRSTRNRSRRPTRMYTERNRRRWPNRRPEPSRHRRPELPSPYRHYEEFDDFEHTHSDYIMHCKRTGNC